VTRWVRRLGEGQGSHGAGRGKLVPQGTGGGRKGGGWVASQRGSRLWGGDGELTMDSQYSGNGGEGDGQGEAERDVQRRHQGGLNREGVKLSFRGGGKTAGKPDEDEEEETHQGR